MKETITSTQLSVFILPVEVPRAQALSARSFTLRRHKFFKKGQLQGRLKQLSLEQDPGHNIR